MAEGEEEPRASASSPRLRRWRRFAWPVIVLGIVGILVGSLLIVDCTPLQSQIPCSAETNDTCLPSGNCPYAPEGGGLLTVGFVVLIVGFVLLLGRRREGDVPHPEPKAPRAPRETARTRLMREQQEAQERYRERRDD